MNYSAVFQDTALDEAAKSADREIEFRAKSVRNMWLMFVTIFVVITYNTIYSITLYVWADQTCFIFELEWLNSLNTVI